MDSLAHAHSSIQAVSRAGFQISPGMETSHSLGNCPTVYPHNINHLFCSQGISGVLFCACWHLPCQSLFPSGFLPMKYLLSCLLAIPGLHWWLGLFHPMGRTLHFFFLNIIPLFTKLWAQMFSWISVHLTHLSHISSAHDAAERQPPKSC